jgi:hypothetical protein
MFRFEQQKPPLRSNEAVNSGTAVLLAQNQLASRQAYAEHLDTLALGLLGFAGVLITVDVAAQADLGGRWWWPVVGLALCSVLCITTILARAQFRIGPFPALFYERFGGIDEAEANVVLLADLCKALDESPVRRKEQLFTLAFGALLGDVIFAVAVLVVL